MGIKSGFIYVLTHPSDPSLVKVGVTSRNPQERLKEHNTQFDKAVGKIVANTGQLWVLKESYPVDDIYNAESAFWKRYPYVDIPFQGKEELLQLDNNRFTWKWIEDGLEAARLIGVRENVEQPPMPKAKPKRGGEWYEEQLRGSGIYPEKGYGNGVTKVWFKCKKDHLFKLDARSLCRSLCCPVCEPNRYDSFTLNRVGYPEQR